MLAWHARENASADAQDLSPIPLSPNDTFCCGPLVACGCKHSRSETALHLA